MVVLRSRSCSECCRAPCCELRLREHFVFARFPHAFAQLQALESKLADQERDAAKANAKHGTSDLSRAVHCCMLLSLMSFPIHHTTHDVFQVCLTWHVRRSGMCRVAFRRQMPARSPEHSSTDLIGTTRQRVQRRGPPTPRTGSVAKAKAIALAHCTLLAVEPKMPKPKRCTVRRRMAHANSRTCGRQTVGEGCDMW